ncbi:unnamed protein product [Caenorhabditis sp. 36 PRJEB53466]|nr:unnamed protein product [Caenorhabditis sp. 36 PRJEB53466]
MVSYKLTYFPSRGNGEVARQILAYAGQEFVDERIPKDQWPAIKDSTPFGQLPVLYVDGKPLAQSVAIDRFLARQFGIAGKNAWDEAQVDALHDQFKDYKSDARPFFMVKMGFKEGDVEQLRQQVFLPAFRKNYGIFAKALKANGASGFLVGDSVTWLDLAIAQHSEDLLKADGHILDEFPEMNAHLERVHNIPNIKKWIETRPVTER